MTETTDVTERMMPGVPVAARWLGLAGLIPFAGLAGLVILVPSAASWAIGLLIGYGVAILSFMGGCRWGFAAAGLGEGPSFAMLGLSVVPALYAWAVAALVPALALGGLSVGFLALLALDLALSRRRGAPIWWPALRLPLSVGASLALLAAALAVGTGDGAG